MFAFGALGGVVGLAWMTGAWRLVQRSGWRGRLALSEDAIAGTSLRRAQAVLDELRRFEDETDGVAPTA